MFYRSIPEDAVYIRTDSGMAYRIGDTLDITAVETVPDGLIRISDCEGGRTLERYAANRAQLCLEALRAVSEGRTLGRVEIRVKLYGVYGNRVVPASGDADRVYRALGPLYDRMSIDGYGQREDHLFYFTKPESRGPVTPDDVKTVLADAGIRSEVSIVPRDRREANQLGAADAPNAGNRMG